LLRLLPADGGTDVGVGTGEQLGITGLDDVCDGGDRSFLSRLTGSTIMLLLSESRSLSAQPSHDRFDIIIARGSIVIAAS